MTQPLTILNGAIKQTESQDIALWNDVNRIFYGFKKTAFGKELKAVFENLHDKKLIKAMEETRWTGRPGYPIKVMWKSLIVSYVLNISTIQELIRMLHRNPFIAIQCGIFYENEIPSRFAYYRFIKKLITHEVLIEKCMAETINSLQKQLSGFGKIAAVDSTDIQTYSNKYKKPPSDPDARWGYKKNSNGVEKNWLGYKMHTLYQM